MVSALTVISVLMEHTHRFVSFLLTSRSSMRCRICSDSGSPSYFDNRSVASLRLAWRSRSSRCCSYASFHVRREGAGVRFQASILCKRKRLQDRRIYKTCADFSLWTNCRQTNVRSKIVPGSRFATYCRFSVQIFCPGYVGAVL